MVAASVLHSRCQARPQNDYEDLSVLHFVRFTIQASAKVLLRAPPPVLDAAEEETLATQRDWGANMGAAFLPPAANGDAKELAPALFAPA